MNNRKSQNSILFLTTLGVYLGLVLIGATPQVLAQAATAKQFSVKDEIEVKDNLDKKPEGSDIYAESIVSLVRQLGILAGGKAFDWNKTSELIIEDFDFCESDHSRSYSGSGTISKRVDALITDNITGLADRVFQLKTRIGAGEYFAGWPQGLTYKFKVENGELNVEVSIVLREANGAARLGAALFHGFEPALRAPSWSQHQVVTENTKSKVDDTKVILVTHLPRAGLNSLLSNDAK